MEIKIKKIIVPFIILAISFMVIGFVFVKKVKAPEIQSNSYVTEKQDEITTNLSKMDNFENKEFQLYRNKKYGFEFQYPSGFKYNPEMNSGYGENVLFSLVNSTDQKQADVVIFAFNDLQDFARNEISESLDFKTNTLEEVLNLKGNDIFEYKKINLNGYEAYEVEMSGYSSYFTILIEKNNSIYEIRFNFKSKRSELNENEEYIISTFKFIESAGNETANWQTYGSGKYGFEMKYPNNMFLQENSDSEIYFKQTNTGDFMETSNAFKITISQTGEGNTVLDKAKSLDEIAKLLKNEGGVEVINVSGEKLLKFISICEDVGCGKWEWFLVKNGNTFHFDSMLAYDKFELYEQILSTLKFTN